MTFEQTREQFLIALNSNAYLNMCESSDMQNAISALEKQISKKATPHKVEVPKIKIGHGYWGKGTTVYKCPYCDTFVSRIYKHCHECGQALDWSDTE